MKVITLEVAMTSSLQELVGETIIIRSIPINESNPALVKLLSVENGGIWVESQDATDHYLAEAERQSAPKTLVWFLPFAQVAWIPGSTDYPALSEKGFGV